MTRLACWFVSLLSVMGLVFASCAPQGNTAASPTPAAIGKNTPAPAQDKWNTTLSQARKEGTVLVYASDAGPAVKDAVAPVFKERFGITLETVTGIPNELVQKVLTESQRGLYLVDAHITGNSMLTNYKPNGLLDPLPDGLMLPEATDPSAWPGGKLPFADQDKFAFDLTGAYFSYILVNTDLVKPGDLKSYKDLVDPKWKSKLIMMDPTVPGGAVNWMMFILKMAMGPDEGQKFLRQLAQQQEPVVTRDPRLISEWVSRGKYPVAIAPALGGVTPLLRAGAPIAWVRMEEGGLVHPGGSLFGLAKNAPHPNAARVLFNWLLTADGQRVFSKDFGQPALRLGVSTEGIEPFTVVRPGEKVFYANEEFLLEVQTKGPQTGTEIFGPLLK